MTTHRNAYTFIDWMQKEFNIDKNDRVFNQGTIAIRSLRLRYLLHVCRRCATNHRSDGFQHPGHWMSVNLMLKPKKVTICYTKFRPRS